MKSNNFLLILSRDVFVSSLFGGIYLVGVVLLCRQSLAFEIFFSFGVIAIFGLLGMIRPENPRSVTLVLIECWFNLNVVLAKTGILYDGVWLNQLTVYGFFGYFTIQVIGFLKYQKELGRSNGVFATLIGIFVIFMYFFSVDSRLSAMDETGRFFLWGQQMPWWMIANYCSWAVLIIFVNTKALPYLRNIVTHLISIIVSVASGEFFHVRLLTACHILFLDMVFNYVLPTKPLSPFLCIPENWHTYYDEHIRPLIAKVVMVVMVCIAVLAVMEVFWGMAFSDLMKMITG